MTFIIALFLIVYFAVRYSIGKYKGETESENTQRWIDAMRYDERVWEAAVVDMELEYQITNEVGYTPHSSTDEANQMRNRIEQELQITATKK